MKKVINSDSLLSEAIGELRALYMQHRYVRMQLSTGIDRSLDQNATAFLWYDQISKELREYSPHEVRRECKLIFGVPILRVEDADFKAMYDASIKKLPHQDKLKAMDYIDVTSIMTVPQMARYLDSMQKEYSNRGVVLVVREELKKVAGKRKVA